MSTTEITAIEAYRKGFRASARTTTYDLEGAERRFVRRYGSEHHDAFVAGWVDHAADAGFRPEAHGFGAPAEAPAEEAPAAPVVVDAEPDHAGYNPFHLRPRYVVAIKGRPILWTDDPEEASRARAERPGAVIYLPQEDPDLAFHELVDRDPEGHRAWLATRGSSSERHDTEGSLDGVLFDGHLIEEDDEGVRLTTPAGDVHVVAGPSDVPADVPAHVATLVRSIVRGPDMIKRYPDRPEYVVAAYGVPVLWTDSFEEACEALEEPGTVPFDAQRILDLTFDELVARDPEGYRAWLLGQGR